MKTRYIKARAEELSEEYQLARSESFDEQFRDEYLSELKAMDIINEDEIQIFLNNFQFPEEHDWIYQKLGNEIAEEEDRIHDQIKDDILTGDTL